jgi:hypothetical protein
MAENAAMRRFCAQCGSPLSSPCPACPTIEKGCRSDRTWRSRPLSCGTSAHPTIKRIGGTIASAAEGPTVRRLTAGGNRIRTIGPAELEPFRRQHRHIWAAHGAWRRENLRPLLTISLGIFSLQEAVKHSIEVSSLSQFARRTLLVRRPA